MWQQTTSKVPASRSPLASTVANPLAGRWSVLVILCFVYVINFLDRQLLSILAKPIQDDLGVTDGQPAITGEPPFWIKVYKKR